MLILDIYAFGACKHAIMPFRNRIDRSTAHIVIDLPELAIMSRCVSGSAQKWMHPIEFYYV